MNPDGGQAPPPRPRRKSLFGTTKASKAAAAAAQQGQASSSTNATATSSPLPMPSTSSQTNAEAGPSRISPTKKSGHRRSGSHLVRVASTGAGKVLGIGRDRDNNTSSAAASSDQAPATSSSSSPSHSPSRNRSASVGINANISSPLQPPQLDRSPSSASHLETTGRPRSSTWRRLRPGSSLGNHASDVETLNDTDQATTVKGRKTPRASMLAAFKDSDVGGDSNSRAENGQRQGSLSPQPPQRKGLFARSPSFQPSRSDAGASNRDGGLLRRIGSRSRLGEGSRESFNASQDSLASTASSTAASLSRRVGNVAERAMPDWLQSRAKPAEADVGGGSGGSEATVSRHSTEVVTSRAPANGLATPGGRSRSGSASAARHLSPTAEDTASPEGGLPKRLSGWLLNMLGTETSPPPTAAGHSPTMTAAAPLDAKVRRQSNTSVASAGSGSSKAKSAHSHASGGGSGVAGGPVVAKAHHHNAGFLSHARARATAAAGAAASTSGLERALGYIHEGSREEEEIWLLGVRHGREEGAAAVETGQRLGPAIEIHEASAPTSPVKERGDAGESSSPSSPRLDAATRSLQRKSSASEEGPRAHSQATSTSSADEPTTVERPRSYGASPVVSSHKGASLHRIATSNDFQADFSSRIWCTYRNHFGPIARDGTISKEAEEAAAAMAASNAAASAAARAHETASSLSSSTRSDGASTPGGPRRPTSSNAQSPAAMATPRAAGGWLSRRLIDATPGTDTLAHASPSLGAALGVSPGTSPPASVTSGNSNGSASLSLSEKMGIPNLWGRATAAVQATGLTGRSGLTTDSGWGCMLRTGQSLLANALIEVHLGRDWRKTTLPPAPHRDSEANASSPSALDQQRRRHAQYVELLSWFMDDASPACPFSVHRMAREGKRLGKEVGEWFGPSTAAGAIRKLVDEFPQAGLGVSVATDGVVYLSEVRRAAKVPRSAAASSPTMGDAGTSKQRTTRPVLILIGVRLGLEGVHPTYYDSIRQLFTFPQSVGIAGGRPGSSYYFVGFQGDNLLYLDPHNVRPAVPFRHPPPQAAAKQGGPSGGNAQAQTQTQAGEEEQRRVTDWWCQAYSDAELSTYHCDRPRRMPVRSLDPSMLLGFLVDVEEPSDSAKSSLDAWTARVKALPKPIFSVQEQMPRWMRDTGSSVDEDGADEFDFDGEGLGQPSKSEDGGGETGTAASPLIDDDPSLESFSESSQTDEQIEEAADGDGESTAVAEGSLATAASRKTDQRTVLEPSRHGNGIDEKGPSSATPLQASSKGFSRRGLRSPEDSPSSTRWPSEDDGGARPSVARASTVTPAAPLTKPSTEPETERPRLSSMASDATARNAKPRATAAAKGKEAAPSSSSSAAKTTLPANNEEDSVAGHTSTDSSLTTSSISSSKSSSSSVPFPHAKGGSRRDSTGETAGSPIKRHHHHHHERKQSPTSPRQAGFREMQRRQQPLEVKELPAKSPQAPSQPSNYTALDLPSSSSHQTFPQQQQQQQQRQRRL